MGTETVRPGCEVSESTWKAFLALIEDEYGRTRGLVGPELEDLLRAYVEADGDLVADPPGTSSGRVEKEKILPASDGGTAVDDRHLAEDGPSVVERRTEAAVEALLEDHSKSFQRDDLDEAIRRGAGVESAPSIREYRDRVFERLPGDGREDLVHPATRRRPEGARVYFTRPEYADEMVATLQDDFGDEVDRELEDLDGAERGG